MDITVAVSCVSSAECEPWDRGIQQSSADSEQKRRVMERRAAALLLGAPRTCGCDGSSRGNPPFYDCFQVGFMQKAPFGLSDATVMAACRYATLGIWRSRIRLYLRRC
jgi:hypothetical protein